MLVLCRVVNAASELVVQKQIDVRARAGRRSGRGWDPVGWERGWKCPSCVQHVEKGLASLDQPQRRRPLSGRMLSGRSKEREACTEDGPMEEAICLSSLCVKGEEPNGTSKWHFPRGERIR